jgi:hypothetical protein
MRSGVLGRPSALPTWVNQQEGCARSLEEPGAVAERTVKEWRKWSPPAGECCLLVLNLVSSTLSCIRQPRPRLDEDRGRVTVGQGVWYKEGGMPPAGKDVEPASQGPERGDRRA